MIIVFSRPLFQTCALCLSLRWWSTDFSRRPCWCVFAEERFLCMPPTKRTSLSYYSTVVALQLAQAHCICYSTLKTRPLKGPRWEWGQLASNIFCSGSSPVSSKLFAPGRYVYGTHRMYARISSGERAVKSTSVVSQKLTASSILPILPVKTDTPECTKCRRPLRLESIENAWSSSLGFSKITPSN